MSKHPDNPEDGRCDDCDDRCGNAYLVRFKGDWLCETCVGERGKEDAEIAALRAEVERLTRERDEALAANAAAVGAWEEYGRWPQHYSCVPIGRYRDVDGTEKELALRANQIVGITRGIMEHVKTMLPFGWAAVQSHYAIDGLRIDLADAIKRAETAEARVAVLEGALGDIGGLASGAVGVDPMNTLDRIHAAAFAALAVKP